MSLEHEKLCKNRKFGNNQILLTDRGTFMGYNMLVNDMKCFPIMSETGYPVCFDATHSIQLPTSKGNISGGQREFIPSLVRAATAAVLTLYLWRFIMIQKMHYQTPIQY